MGNTIQKNSLGFRHKFAINVMFFGGSLCLVALNFFENPFTSYYRRKISSELQKGQELIIKMQTPDTAAKILYENGLMKFSRENYLGSIADLKKTIELAHENSPENNLFRAKCQLLIGQAYQNLEKHKEALERFQEALELFKSLSFQVDEEKTVFADLLHFTGISYRCLDDFVSAQEYLEHASRMRQKLYGSTSVAFSETVREIALLYYSTQSYGQARECFELVMEILHKNSSEEIVRDKLRYLYASDIIKLCQSQLLPSKRSTRLLHSMVDLVGLPQRNPDVEALSKFLYSLGKLLVSGWQRKEGFEYLRTSLEVMSSKYDKRHPKIQELYSKVYRVYISNFRSPQEIIDFMEGD